jgi:ech hydrogenase subunit D
MNYENQNLLEIGKDQLLSKVKEMSDTGHRLVQICGSKLPSHWELNYSFDKDFKYTNFKIIVNSLEEEIPSVSSIYWSALLYENEIHDLYGIRIKDIVLDYHGHFYQTKIKTPFSVATPSGLSPERESEKKA